MGCHTWFYRDKEHLNKQLSCEYHDVFRASWDEDTILTNYEDTIKYIKENNCKIFDYTFDKLKEFFEKYPKGVIEFG